MSRRLPVTLLLLVALLGGPAGCALSLGGTSPSQTSGPSTPAPAVATPADPDALLRQVLGDYNARNNTAIEAARHGDWVTWELADTLAVLGQDRYATRYRSVNNEPLPALVVQFQPVRQYAVQDGGTRRLVAELVADLTYATPPATTAPSVGNQVVVFRKDGPNAHWLMGYQVGLPAGVTLPQGELRGLLPEADAKAFTDATGRLGVFVQTGVEPPDLSVSQQVRDLRATLVRNDVAHVSRIETGCVLYEDTDPRTGVSPAVLAFGVGQAKVAVVALACDQTYHAAAGRTLRWPPSLAPIYNVPEAPSLKAPFVVTAVLVQEPDSPIRVLGVDWGYTI